MLGSVDGAVASGTEVSVGSANSSVADLLDGIVLSSICELLPVSLEGDGATSMRAQADRRRLKHKKSMNSVFFCMDTPLFNIDICILLKI